MNNRTRQQNTRGDRKGESNHRPWDSRQEMDIRHHWLPLGLEGLGLIRYCADRRGKCIKGLWREATQREWSFNKIQHTSYKQTALNMCEQKQYIFLQRMTSIMSKTVMVLFVTNMRSAFSFLFLILWVFPAPASHVMKSKELWQTTHSVLHPT